jgi:hypothetical protein
VWEQERGPSRRVGVCIYLDKVDELLPQLHTTRREFKDGRHVGMNEGVKVSVSVSDEGRKEGDDDEELAFLKKLQKGPQEESVAVLCPDRSAPTKASITVSPTLCRPIELLAAPAAATVRISAGQIQGFIASPFGVPTTSRLPPGHLALSGTLAFPSQSATTLHLTEQVIHLLSVHAILHDKDASATS